VQQKLTAQELLELELESQIENSYSVKPAVVGLADVDAGFKPLYPVTVYQLSGDDTSGIAGLLMPSGDFLPVPEAPPRIQRYWEFDETLKYEAVENTHISDINPGATRVVGNSWTEGETVWDGTSAKIDTLVEMETEVNENARFDHAKGTMFNKAFKVKVTPHVRRADINSLTGDRETVAPERLGDHRQAGRIHGVATTEDYGGWRQAA
jgi:hypothetical protein